MLLESKESIPDKLNQTPCTRRCRFHFRVWAWREVFFRAVISRSMSAAVFSGPKLNAKDGASAGIQKPERAQNLGSFATAGVAGRTGRDHHAFATKHRTTKSASAPGHSSADVRRSLAQGQAADAEPGLGESPIQSCAKFQVEFSVGIQASLERFGAVPKPTIPATFSVPLRRLDSWPPP